MARSGSVGQQQRELAVGMVAEAGGQRLAPGVEREGASDRRLKPAFRRELGASRRSRPRKCGGRAG
jgi:hypothetical protein